MRAFYFLFSTFLLFSLVRSSETSSQELNLRPIVGVLTEDVLQYKDREEPEIDEGQYVAASYVKYLESAGMRVVAVKYNQPKEDVQKILSKLNGLLLPGGGMKFESNTPWFDTGLAIWEFSQQNPDFPIFGICLGFEFLAAVATGSPRVLEFSGEFDALGINLPLSLTSKAGHSRLMGFLSEVPFIRRAVLKEDLTFNAHHLGVSLDAFYQFEGLVKNFDLLATGKDKKGRAFVAAMEHKTLPIYGVQFHPEKPVFEWTLKGGINHQPDAIVFAHMLIAQFAHDVRNNHNTFGVNNDKESEYLIQNYQRVYSRKGYFMEVFSIPVNGPQLGLSESNGHVKTNLRLVEV